MQKNLLYLVATLVALLIVAMFFAPKQEEQAVDPTALPTNGLMEGSTPPADASGTASQDGTTAMPGDTMGGGAPADDVPPGAEVSGEQSPDATDAGAAGTPLPPSEGSAPPAGQ